MPIDIRYLDEGRGVLWKAYGHLSGKEVMETNTEVHSEPERMKSYRYVLVDLTDVESVQISNNELVRIVAQDELAARSRPQSVVAIAAPTDVMFGISRMWEAHVDQLGWDTAVFRTRREADQWIVETVRRLFSEEVTCS